MTKQHLHIESLSFRPTSVAVDCKWYALDSQYNTIGGIEHKGIGLT